MASKLWVVSPACPLLIPPHRTALGHTTLGYTALSSSGKSPLCRVCCIPGVFLGVPHDTATPLGTSYPSPGGGGLTGFSGNHLMWGSLSSFEISFPQLSSLDTRPRVVGQGFLWVGQVTHDLSPNCDGPSWTAPVSTPGPHQRSSGWGSSCWSQSPRAVCVLVHRWLCGCGHPTTCACRGNAADGWFHPKDAQGRGAVFL